MQSKREKPNNEAKQEIVVFWIIKPSQCTECRTELFKGSLLRLEQEKALCTDCADLGHLEFLASGDTAVTGRATKYSKLRAVVVRWSRARKRYERQGILVEPEAIIRAEEESLADTEVRERRQARVAERRAVEDQDFMASFARAIREQYPNCPAGRRQQLRNMPAASTPAASVEVQPRKNSARRRSVWLWLRISGIATLTMTSYWTAMPIARRHEGKSAIRYRPSSRIGRSRRFKTERIKPHLEPSGGSLYNNDRSHTGTSSGPC